MAEWRALAKNKGRPVGATDGFTKSKRNKLKAQAKAEAKEILEHMEKNGIELPKDAYAREGLEAVVEQMRRTDLHPKDKLAAARTLLEYTMAKPASETTVNVKKAEDFLNDLVTDMNLEK